MLRQSKGDASIPFEALHTETVVFDGDQRGVVKDLTGLTLMPGGVDTHVHIASHFDDDGRVHRARDDSKICLIRFTTDMRRKTLQPLPEYLNKINLNILFTLP